MGSDEYKAHTDYLGDKQMVSVAGEQSRDPSQGLVGVRPSAAPSQRLQWFTITVRAAAAGRKTAFSAWVVGNGEVLAAPPARVW